MKQLTATLALSMLLAGAVAPSCAWCADDVAVAGVVRDVHGTPLLGALVQLLGQHAVVLAQTFTDDRGRYRLQAELPGEYQVRASGAFLLPTTLSHLRLQAGARAAADLTMLALFEVGTILPAEKPTSAQPADDWRWTLRSIANRPLLRWVEASTQGNGEAVPGENSLHPDPALHGRLLLEAGDGGFGNGGALQEIALRRNEPGDIVSMLRADVDGNVIRGPGKAYFLAAGLQHDRALGGSSRFVVSFASHPDLRTGEGSQVQVLRAAATDRVTLGDEITVDAGTLLTVEQIAGPEFVSAPYVSVSVQPSPGFRVEYHLATDKALQRSEDLDGGSLSEEVMSDASGHALLRRGLHQELIAVQSKPNREVSLAVYRDFIPFEAVQGEGDLTLHEAAGLPVIVDPDTETLRVAVRGYTASGVGFGLSQEITPMFLARFDGQIGTALSEDGTVPRLNDLDVHLRALRTAALTGTLTVHTSASGTVLRVHYRWQPVSTLTQVDEFDDVRAQAFLGFDLRQRLCRGHRFHEVEAVVESSNVLAQGYELAHGPEGQALRLTQEARSVQGGLAFSF